MAKHDRAKQEKRLRNLRYALKFEQRKCEDCGHRSGRRFRCRMCGGIMKRFRFGAR